MKLSEVPKFVIFSFFVVIIWISYEIFLSSFTSSISEEEKKIAEPLSINLNEKMLESLNEKTLYKIDSL